MLTQNNYFIIHFCNISVLNYFINLQHIKFKFLFCLEVKILKKLIQCGY